MRHNRQSGAFVAVGASVGTTIGALAAVTTDNWSWMPLALSVCIGLGAVAAWKTGRGVSR